MGRTEGGVATVTQEYWPVRQTPQEYWPDTRGNVHSDRAAGDRRNAERRESEVEDGHPTV